MLKLKKKLILGSANFSHKYGIIPTKVDPTEIKKILLLAKKNNINTIDTAESYLNDISFFKNSKKTFKFITKIKPDYNWVSLSYCEDKLNKHIENLNNNKIETLLFHDVKILFTKRGSKIFNNLKILKKKGYFKKIGISIYNVNCLKYLISNYNLNVVQCPYNILDKRIIFSGWFSRLKKKGIEIHIRSIFLQGLLLNKKILKKSYFNKWKKKILKWYDHLEKKKISPLNYCLNDSLEYDFDQIIIGINNSDNLKEILNFKLIKNRDNMINFKINDLKLIDPRNWK
tara:strand:+ start:2555 stop:3412 length:858 start_codon:yes stop_codon:yes gene_type:complete